MKSQLTIVPVCMVVAILAIAQSGFAEKNSTLLATERAMDQAVARAQWAVAYQQARQVSALAEAGSESAEKAAKVLEQAQAQGRTEAAKVAASSDPTKMIAFIRDWQPSDCTAEVVKAVEPYARAEFNQIMTKPDPYPRYPVRTFLVKWIGIPAPACKEALAGYDAQAKPQFDAAMGVADRTERANKLKIFIIQWRPSSLIADARDGRQTIANEVFQEIRSIDDELERRRELGKFVKNFPDSKQVAQAKEDLGASRPVVVAGGGGSHGGGVSRGGSNQRAIIEKLDHQAIEKIEHQKSETIDRHARENLDQQNIETEKMQHREKEEGQAIESETQQNLEKIENQDVEQDRQQAEGGGRGAQQARQGVANKAQTNASQTARKANTNQADQARQGKARSAQRARQGKARTHTVND